MHTKFNINHTNIIKGIAIFMLLWHHLFFDANIDVINGNHSITGFLAYYGKVCVAIFLLLSGYGITESYRRKPLGITEFYKKNLKKLYVNYWVMWIIFVPIGVFVFGRSFSQVYSDNIMLKFLINLLGFQRVFGFEGYNPTWWFMSLILGLYIIYPILIKPIKEHLNLSLFISFLIMFIPSIKILGLDLIFVYGNWVFPFMLGVYFSEKNLFEKFKLSKVKYKLPLLITALILLCVYRLYGKVITGVRIDGFISVIVILLVYLYISQIKVINGILERVGEMSFDIFLFHTFIYYYYFTDFIYSFNSPLVIFAVLLTVCILIAWLLAKLKRVMYQNGINKSVISQKKVEI